MFLKAGNVDQFHLQGSSYKPIHLIDDGIQDFCEMLKATEIFLLFLKG